MPTWGDVLEQLREKSEQGVDNPFDELRREYLQELTQYTNRNTILYSTSWTQADNASPGLVSITDEDIQGFMEVVHGIDDRNLDLILHSPGGSPEATEPIVRYLRDKFDDIRIFVPHAAMSAAAMLCCAGDEILMGRHSSIGPIDTQLILNTEMGQRSIPAQAILDQFDQAQKECQDASNLGYWTPILRGYGPSLIQECEDAIELSKQLSKEWAEEYMFSEESNAEQKAENLVSELSDYQQFRSHNRHIHREQAREFGFKITNLESDQRLQDLILSIYHATTHTHSGTDAVKIIENQNGNAFIKQSSQQKQVIPVQQGPGNQLPNELEELGIEAPPGPPGEPDEN